MFGKDATSAERRRKLRRIALTGFLTFCAISAVLHFTAGAIIARLFHGQAPPPQVAQAISILTITRITPEERVAFEPIEQQKVTPKQVTQPTQKQLQQMQQQHLVRADTQHSFARSAVATITAPHMTTAVPTSAHPNGSAAKRSVIEVMSPNGFNPQQVPPNSASGNGEPGTGSAEDPGDPGKQAPTGAVWSEHGPQGTGSSGGGIILEGGGGAGGGHDSCAPSRGGFLGQ